LQRVRALLEAPVGGNFTDRELLERFSTSRDEAAFETIVRRHGGSVLGVCQRVLGNVDDAEDAFQAVFLILARKAESVRWQASVGGWLYQVAYHVAIRARRAQARRRTHELRAPPMESRLCNTTPESDLRPIIDDELQRLPAKYRLPLLLCYLQGKTREEAAEHLGWTPGEVKGRLEKGRELLRGRLVRRGLVASGVALPTVFTSEVALALPTKLISTTVRAAIAGSGTVAVNELMQGALQVMFWNKLKKVALVAAVVAVLGGSGVVGMMIRPSSSTARAVPLPPKAERPAKAAPPAVEKNGLSVTVVPARRDFAVQEPLAFTVTFKNVSREPFFLAEAGYFWDWKITCGQFWQVQPLFDAKRAYPPSQLLEPGQEIRTEVVLDEKRSPFQFKWIGEQEQSVGPRKFLSAGKYPLALDIRLSTDRRAERRGDYKHPHWTGEIATKPVEIEINDEGVISWGKARNGIRLGISPRSLTVAADQEAIEITAWFENIGKQDGRVHLWDEIFSFKGKKGKANFDAVYEMGPRAAWPPSPAPLTLKPGQRERMTLRVPFEGRQFSNSYVGLLRPTAAEPVTLAAVWNAKKADELESDSMQIRLKVDR
jgi:RNA polymerase sigma factor (sigma-70 family)